MDEKNRRFQAAQQEAQELIRQQEKLNRLLQEAVEKARKHRRRLQEMWEELQLILKMVRAYSRGEYRKIPWKTLIFAVAAIIYFVNPFDMVPDFIPGIGFLDDATVIAFVVNAIREELEKFKLFQQGKSAVTD